MGTKGKTPRDSRQYPFFILFQMKTLTLTKGQTLNLKKEDGTTNVSKIRAELSYDPAEAGQAAMDLDIVVVHKESETVAYYNAPKAIEGVELSADNRTGEGEGADEFAKLDATKTSDGTYVILADIHEAAENGQNLSMVKNAKVTIIDEETGAAVAEFPLTENGGDNTGIILAEIKDSGDNYAFTAVGRYVKGDLNALIAAI